MAATKKFCLLVLIIVIVVITAVGASQLQFLLLRMTSQFHPCEQVNRFAIVRDPNNCSHYILCVTGQRLDLSSCPSGHVWSVRKGRCVPVPSPWNDCPTSPDTSHTTSLNRNDTSAQMALLPYLPDLLGHLTGTSHKVKAGHLSLVNSLSLSGAKTNQHPCTNTTNNNNTILPYRHACHRYYNCSRSDEELPRDPDPLVMDCPYPDLFSLESKTCVHYTKVDCQDRQEYKTPCDYKDNCHKSDSSHCSKRLASCLGLMDGPHSFPSQEWTPWYIVCKDERTLEQTMCNPPTHIFSPDTRSCVTSAWVPKQHGGHKPLCETRQDGFHPDEHGNCSEFFQCQNGEFLNYFTCNPGLHFDPETSTCISGLKAPPCGNQTSPDILAVICKGSTNGFHPDPYGRCALYMECRDQRLNAYLKCLKGSFNPATKSCVESYVLVPPPCGFASNVLS